MSVRPRDNPEIVVVATETLDGVAQDDGSYTQVVVPGFVAPSGEVTPVQVGANKRLPVDANLGSPGTTPPTLAAGASGLLGLTRALLDAMEAFVPGDTVIELGAIGDSPPSMVANADGLLGLVRTIVDLAAQHGVQLGDVASGTELVGLLAGVDLAGMVNPVSVDAQGRIAVRDTTDVIGSPALHARSALDGSGKLVVAANSLRTYIEVQNCLASDIVMKLSATAPTAMTDGDVLSRGMSWSGFYTGPISFFGNGGAAAANAVSVKYWTSG